MIGPLTEVLGGPAPELRPGHQQNIVGFAVPGQVGLESRDPIGEGLEQVRVVLRLDGVGVEAAEHDVANP